MKKFLLVGFGVSVIGELTGILLSIDLLVTICKPAIMLMLGLYYLSSVSRERRSMLLILAIVFSCLGDVLLMLVSKKESMFIFGLLSFLIAHVLYILTYRQHRVEAQEDRLQGVQKARLAFPIVLAGTGMIIVLNPVVGSLQLPIVLYTIVMIVMVLNALFRYGHTTARSFQMVFVGAVAFMISDSILAINKFLQPIELANFWIMLTYCVAQFLIVDGLVRHGGDK